MPLRDVKVEQDSFIATLDLPLFSDLQFIQQFRGFFPPYCPHPVSLHNPS